MNATFALTQSGTFAVRAATAALLILVAGCASDSPSGASGSRLPSSPVDRPFDPRASAKAHTELAAGYLELGNMGVALEEARIAVATDASYGPGHSILGLVQTELREHGPAQVSFNNALRLDPKDPDINHNYGWFLCQTGRERESIQYFLKAIENPLYPSPAKSHLTAGSCLLKVGETKGAGDQIDIALRRDGNYAAALLAGARIDYAQGNLERARERIGRFNQTISPTAESLWLALRIERRRGDRSAEASYAAQLRRRFPSSREMQAYDRGQFE